MAHLVAAKPLEGRFADCVAFKLNRGAEFTVGRAVDNFCHLPHPTISRRHCVVQRSSDLRQWTVRDISANVMRLNGRRLAKNVDTILSDGDRLQLDGPGLFVYTFHLDKEDNGGAERQPAAGASHRSNAEVSANANPTPHGLNMERIVEGIECSICSEPFFRATDLDCGHTFCEPCIVDWNKGCPMCRTKITRRTRNSTLDALVDNFVDEDYKRRREALAKEKEAAKKRRKEPERGTLVVRRSTRPRKNVDYRECNL